METEVVEAEESVSVAVSGDFICLIASKIFILLFPVMETGRPADFFEVLKNFTIASVNLPIKGHLSLESKIEEGF